MEASNICGQMHDFGLTVVNGYTWKSKSIAVVNWESVDRRPIDGQPGDRPAQFTEPDKLGLINATVTTFAVPVQLNLTVNRKENGIRPSG